LVELLPNQSGIDAAIEELEQRGMLSTQDDVVEISHPLFREIVVVATPAEVRRDLHARAMRVHEQFDAPIEVRALHSFHAQDSLQALLLFEQVAERALARGDEAAAVNALRRALELAREEIYRGQLDDPMRAVAIFGRKLGDALTQAGNFSDAEGVLREALDMAGPSGVDRAQVLASLAQVAHQRARRDEATDYLEQAIEVAKQSGSGELVTSLSSTKSSWA
jgi:serine/threonine-protein kinase